RVIVLCTEAEAGAEPGNTTTRVPTVTRLNRSSTSSLVSRMQPDDTKVPMVDGWLVPWMRYTVLPRYIARAPSGLVSPPAMKRGRYGWGGGIFGAGGSRHATADSLVLLEH